MQNRDVPGQDPESRDDLWSPWSIGPHGRGGRREDPGTTRDAWSRPRADGPQRGRAGGPQRGRARASAALSRAEIVDAAIAVADAEGPEAVSMRRIAQVLQAGTMSLYWHVAGKEQLIDLMLETLFGEIEVPGPSGDWRADLRAYARSHRASLRRHRWVIDYIGARPALGPNTLRVVERSLALLAPLRLDAGTTVNILQVISTYVMGAVLREFQEIRAERDQDRMTADLEQAGVSSGEIEAEFAAWRGRLKAAGGFDNFVRVFEDGVDPDAAQTRDDRFEFGLDCVLAGIAATVAAP